MTRTYKATGINLKSMPMGESDRLLTILTKEHGLIRAVAVGARKHHSKIGGRSELFVVNDLLIVNGRTLDKISQAETLSSYPGLGQDLGKLTASQYLAELTLFQALSDQPQEELFYVLSEHLHRIEQASAALVPAHLVHATFQLLVLAGIAPHVQACCVTQQPVAPDLADPDWRVGFVPSVGGIVSLAGLDKVTATNKVIRQSPSNSPKATPSKSSAIAPSGVAETPAPYRTPAPLPHRSSGNAGVAITQLNADEVTVLQHLAQPELPQLSTLLADHQKNSSPQLLRPINIWLSIERVLRQYTEYYFERPIRSAALIDACFATLPTAL